MALTALYNYPNPVPGLTTPPLATLTPPQNPTSSVKYQDVTVQLTGDGTATNIVITHNFQLTAAELAQGWPDVYYEPIVASAPSHYVSVKAANSVTVAFNSTTTATFGNIKIKHPSSVNK